MVGWAVAEKAKDEQDHWVSDGHTWTETKSNENFILEMK